MQDCFRWKRKLLHAIGINMLEALGVKSGAISTGKLVILLKMLGIDYVFGTNNSADMNDNC